MQASNPAGTTMARWKITVIANPFLKPSANSLTWYVAGVAQVTSVVLGVGVDMEHCTTAGVGGPAAYVTGPTDSPSPAPSPAPSVRASRST
jgi:hypothetical protein